MGPDEIPDAAAETTQKPQLEKKGKQSYFFRDKIKAIQNI